MSTETQTTEKTPAPRKRGFAAMDPEKVKAIASKGGKAAHVAGTAHQFSSDEARKAGLKGGKAPHVRRGRGPKGDRVAIAKGEVDPRQLPLPGALVGPGAHRSGEEPGSGAE